MARLKYTPTTPDSGFRPIQLSRQEISRMQEESNRVVDNMERNRRAEIEQRRETLRTMQADAEYTERANQRNFEIEQQNFKVQAVQAQLDAQTQQGQAQAQTKQAEAIFGGLALFSQSAGEIAAKVEKDRKEKEINSRYIRSSVGLDSLETIEFRNAELALREQGEIYETNAKIQEGQGVAPNPVAKVKFANPAVTYATNRGSATYLLTDLYPRALDNRLNDTETQIEWKGRMVTPSMARTDPELLQTIAQVEKINFLKKHNLWGLEDKMLIDGLKAADRYISSLAKTASDAQTGNIYTMRREQLVGLASNEPNRLLENIPTIFSGLSSDPSLGKSGALDIVQSFAIMRTGDQFTFTMETLRLMDIKSNGNTFDKEFPARWAAMQEARVNAELKAAGQAEAADDIAYNNDVKRIMTGLQTDNRQANVEAARDFFLKNWQGRIPQELKIFEGHTVEAKEKKKAVERFMAIPSGFVTAEAVEAAEAVDYELGREIRRRYLEQESRYNSGIYKETAESFKTTANGVTAYGTNKPNTPASVFLQAMMRSEFRKRVDKAVAGGMEFNAAATTIGQQLDAEVKKGARDANSKWYRKTDAPGGSAQFPNLNKGMLSALDLANRRYSQLKQNIKANGLEKTIDTRGSIITQDEANEIVKNYNKPGFVIPQDVLAVSGMSAGLDPMVIINRQLAALGMAPLKPPPSMSSVNGTVSPAFKRLLYKTPSINRSIRGLGSAQTFNPEIIPNRLGSIIQQTSQRNNVNPSYIAALAEIESGFKPDNVSYNGSSFGVMQISKADHPAFFEQQNWKDPQANIDYGAKYYAGLLAKYKDPVAAAMAYNAGPGNYDAYLRGELPDGRVKTEMLNHGKKFGKALYKYGGTTSLNNPNLLRSGHSNLQLISSANSYVGMDTSDGPDAGRKACVWAVNKVMRAAGMNVPWGNSVYVPDVKKVLDKVGRRVDGPVPGAIAIMQDNHPTDPYPHMGIVRSDGTIISNSTSRAKFDWVGTAQEYEQEYGGPNLYYLIN